MGDRAPELAARPDQLRGDAAGDVLVLKGYAEGKERVLVVEDDPQVLQFVASQLLSLGYEVTAVSDGPDALASLERDTTFDLLLSDLVLPKGMSGVDLARFARRIKPDPKVILTSGYSEDVFQQHGRLDDETPLLRKPYKRKELAEMLRSVLADPPSTEWGTKSTRQSCHRSRQVP
jgi:CheY-like chemotaxis protein